MSSDSTKPQIHLLGYKAYHYAHLPWFETLSEYEPAEFEEEAYAEHYGYNQKLRCYLDEMEVYVKHLCEAARLRELDYERRFKDVGRDECPEHRHWRVNFTAMTQQAQEKLRYWNSVYHSRVNKTKRRKQRTKLIREMYTQSIDVHAVNTDHVEGKENVVNPPRLSKKTQDQRLKDRALRQQQKDDEKQSIVLKQQKEDELFEQCQTIRSDFFNKIDNFGDVFTTDHELTTDSDHDKNQFWKTVCMYIDKVNSGTDTEVRRNPFSDLQGNDVNRKILYSGVYTKEVVQAARGYASWVVLKKRDAHSLFTELTPLVRSVPFGWFYIRELIALSEQHKVDMSDAQNVTYYASLVMIVIGSYSFEILVDTLLIDDITKNTYMSVFMKRIWRSAHVFMKNLDYGSLIELSQKCNDKQTIRDIGRTLEITNTIHTYHVPLPMYRGKLQTKYMSVMPAIQDLMEKNKATAVAIIRRAEKGV